MRPSVNEEEKFMRPSVNEDLHQNMNEEKQMRPSVNEEEKFMRPSVNEEVEGIDEIHPNVS